MAEKTVLSPGSTFSGLSRYALDAIKGKWGVTMGVFVLNIAIKSIAQQAPVFGGLVGFLLLPLDVGVMAFCLKLIRREKTPIESIFDPFSDFWHYVWGGVRVALVVFLWSLPLIAFFLLFSVVVLTGMNSDRMDDMLPLILVLLTMLPVACIPAYIAAVRYSMTLYIMVDHPEYSAKDAMEESDAITYGHKWQYFGYSLLIGLIAIPVTIFTFFIGLLWLIPWAGVFTASFYESIRRRDPVYGISLDPDAAQKG